MVKMCYKNITVYQATLILLLLSISLLYIFYNNGSETKIISLQRMSDQSLVGKSEIIPYKFDVEGVQSDVLTFACNVTFSRNIKPNVTWKFNDGLSIEEYLIINKGEILVEGGISYTISMFVTLNMRKISCEVENQNLIKFLPLDYKFLSYSTDRRVTSVYKIPVVEGCSFVTNMVCNNFVWIGDNGFEFFGKVLIFNSKSSKLHGRYTCYALCEIRGKPTLVKANTVNVHFGAFPDYSDEKLATLSTCIMILIGIALFITLEHKDLLRYFAIMYRI